MKISRNKVSRAALALALLAGTGIAFAGQQQQDRPESLLPPGFDEPAPAPAPAPVPARTQPPVALPTDTVAIPSDEAVTNESVAATAEPAPVEFAGDELPDSARHTLARVGAFAWGNPAFSARAFGRANGKYLSVLMRRLGAPVASRWASIALRRALMSPVDTPRGVNGADFAAERAWLLLRMGESVAARALIADVDVDDYTPKLFQVAMQSALANADPGGLCPIADGGAKLLPAERGWGLARAICAGLAGQPTRGGQLLDAARGAPNDLDSLLAEKILGMGASARRAVTIEWQGVHQLSAWRWGLATAAREPVPAELYGTVGPQVRYWRALAPAVEPIDRAQSAELAAAQGVFSNSALVNLYAEIEENGGGSSGEVAVARDLRAASTAATPDDRVKALRTLWTEATTPRTRYARLVLTARVAAALAPSRAFADDADQIVGSMLSVGLEAPALAWRDIVRRGSDAWLLLAIADPAAGGAMSAGDFGAYRGSASERKAQLALAGLAGLGRLDRSTVESEASRLGVDIAGANAWTRSIDTAARRGDAGSVALLAAVGMQTRRWERVTPEALFHIVAAFRAAGMAEYARMIAAEAITRA